MLIFVFDPLAITLVIATNQAFNYAKPKNNIYGEPKPIEPKPIIEPILEPKHTIDPNIEIERQNILKEISKIERSGVAHAVRGRVITELNNRLSSLNDNTKTY